MAELELSVRDGRTAIRTLRAVLHCRTMAEVAGMRARISELSLRSSHREVIAVTRHGLNGAAASSAAVADVVMAAAVAVKRGGAVDMVSVKGQKRREKIRGGVEEVVAGLAVTQVEERKVREREEFDREEREEEDRKAASLVGSRSSHATSKSKIASMERKMKSNSSNSSSSSSSSSHSSHSSNSSQPLHRHMFPLVPRRWLVSHHRPIQRTRTRKLWLNCRETHFKEQFILNIALLDWNTLKATP